jgi:rare lipoprotein A
MKHTLLILLLVFTALQSQAYFSQDDSDGETTRSSESNYEQDIYSESTMPDFEEKELLIIPLIEVAGKTANRPNCSCSGTASWYGPGFHGKRTASGAKFDQNAMTAAHRCLPLGTKIMVCLKSNPKKCINVTINDRGPYVGKKILDHSKGAATKLGFISKGNAQVNLSRCK